MIGKIAVRNIFHKPLSSILSIALLMFSVGIITLLLIMQHQLEEKFGNDLRNIDMVIGAKGSPLQLVLSSIYHMDAPTGNIKIAEAKKFVTSPIVESAIPLAYGDSYGGYRILGTTHEYIEKYDGELRSGKLFEKNMEAVIGANVAAQSDLEQDATFYGVHGEVEDGGHIHEEHAYKVVGVLKPTNSVLDNLVLSNVQSVWQVHDMHGGEAHSVEKTEVPPDEIGFDHDHGDEDHDHDHSKDVVKADSMEVTAYLMKFNNRIAMLNLPNIINNETKMQAALPGLEINRLFHMMGIGASTLQLIAAAIMLMSAFSVFFVLFNRLRERKYEMALLRASGYKPAQLFVLLLTEGLILAALGYLFGFLLSRLGLYLLNEGAASDFHISFDLGWIPQETGLLLLTLLVGIVAALIPAIKAMRMDVSTALTES
ncbi:MAG: ABC transporter permease [Saprospiraceae bacterium]|nr:ABC transporter permease [Saprospiraceae bacterium]